jgi:hypothetical protein
MLINYMEKKMNNDYKAVYKNTGSLPRRLSRPEDAVAIHTFKTENERAVALVKDFVILMCVFGAVAMLIAGMFYGN